MENSELLPCPFCGGEARYGTEEDLAVGGGVSLRYQVYCGKCLALCDSRKSERAAITAWNTRTQPRVTVEEVRECMAKARFNDVYPIGYPNDAGGCMSWEELPVHAKKRWFDKDAEVMLQAIKAAHPHLFKE